MSCNYMWIEFVRLGGNIMEKANTCKKLKTDEDRINYMTELWKTLNFKPRVHKESKNVRWSEAFREQGNELYISGFLTKEKCFRALKLYSKSIAYAPMGSKEQAIAFANRSAALYRLEKYAECLEDIERAIALDYPDALRSKLDQRKIECLAALKNSTLDDPMEEGKRWLTEMSVNQYNRTKFYYKIKHLLEEVPEEDNPSCWLKHFIAVMKKPNPEAPCASDAVAIKYNKKYGRHIVATRDIEPSEVLIVEKPYVVVVRPEHIRTHCYRCSEFCWSLIPCNTCAYAMYCSEGCKNADWKASHDIECPIFHALDSSGFTKLDLTSFRLTILAIRRSGGIENIKKIMKEVDQQTDMRIKGFSKDGVYQNDHYRSVYSLITNTENQDAYDLLERTFNSSVIAYFLSVSPNQTLIPEDVDAFAFVGALILRHQQMIAINGFNGRHFQKEGLTPKFSAVMPFMSLLCHGCDSNIDECQALGYCVVWAVYPIKKGQQILTSYYSCYSRTSPAKRRHALSNQYDFICDCVPCRENWPLYDNMKSYKDLVPSLAKRHRIAKALTKFNKYYNDSFDFDHSVEKSDIKKDLLRMIRVLYDNAPVACLEMVDVLDTFKRYSLFYGKESRIP